MRARSGLLSDDYQMTHRMQFQLQACRSALQEPLAAADLLQLCRFSSLLDTAVLRHINCIKASMLCEVQNLPKSTHNPHEIRSRHIGTGAN